MRIKQVKVSTADIAGRGHRLTSVTCSSDCTPLPQPKLVLNVATPEECTAELTWVVVIPQDSLPVKNGHVSQK